MKMSILVLSLATIALVPSVALSQSCMQSFNVDSDVTISSTPVNGMFSGWNCVTAELYRQKLFVENRSLFEDDVFSRADEWLSQRNRLLARLKDAESRYAAALADEKAELAQTILLYEVGMIMAAFVCPSTGSGVALCVAGIIKAKYELIDTLVSSGGESDAIRRQLADLRSEIAATNALSAAELGQALQAYRTESDLLCGVIQRECLR